MYLRITQRQNRDGSTVAYYALAESVWTQTSSGERPVWCTVSVVPIRLIARRSNGW
jgi:hypothetical protein